MRELIIITGMSGAGKSVTLKFFEDREYFCIDNFPIQLFQYIGQIFLAKGKRDKIAVSIDIRDMEIISKFEEQLDILDDEKIKYSVIYLDAKNDILLNRYELSRRKHPLKVYDTLLSNIKKERHLIEKLKPKANIVIDTSTISTKELYEILEREYTRDISKLNINLTSFGFKYGIPLDLDLMFDLRFLPNPYYIEDLKNKTGNHIDVYNYVVESEESKKFYKMLFDMLVYLIPEYEEEGKAHLRIGIGCSGGQHRSVSYVNKLHKELSEEFDYKITYYHREVGEKEIV
ncbi:glmZ(sRNA)-inactivating NTPase [Sebaldella termitidis]|jgi:UPF0042 nucleotide-binding protein|uniref:Uncharacterized protein n=1 Tax=Sebaldella termitidis (strain ATCC 33386 / NCTC 11300) TaxID=526218 RepID=D1AFX7_SEBTE|nr:RNase adapter RapZ [Sebaldella termitidis]ACZ08012.1 conserved hypothetical protein [Sebaldella termitidis ATCC 33386]MBP7979392.1 RNase adapter RapZ [Sebaldella sp.]SUI23313.1 glmZ(sRNA)-inactivating NTPase [Sebaldella termitidis]